MHYVIATLIKNHTRLGVLIDYLFLQSDMSMLHTYYNPDTKYLV